MALVNLKFDQLAGCWWRCVYVCRNKSLRTTDEQVAYADYYRQQEAEAIVAQHLQQVCLQRSFLRLPCVVLWTGRISPPHLLTKCYKRRRNQDGLYLSLYLIVQVY